MAIGQIDRFPINTIYEFASSIQFGLCPQLLSFIHELLYDCDPDTPVSEHGIRLALNLLSDFEGKIRNVGAGYTIWSHTLGEVEMHKQLNIITSSTLETAVINNTIVLTGIDTGPDGTNPDTGDFELGFSVQGGKYQYVMYINAEDIDPVHGGLLVVPALDNVIGKIFIKAEKGFNSTASKLSIGTESNRDGYVKAFDVPLNDDFLLRNDIQKYGGDLYQREYDWIDPSKVQAIKIYTEGAQVVGGILKINIFYDKVDWSPDYGYVYTGTDTARTRNLSRFDINNETVSVRRTGLTIPISHFNVNSYNDWLYIAGGTQSLDYTDIGYYTTQIFKTDAKNDITQEITRGQLPIPRIAMSSVKSNTELYHGGGITNPANPGVVDMTKFFFANNTNATASTNLGVRRAYATAGQSDTYGYFAGGQIGSELTSSIDRLTFSTGSMSSAPNLLTAVKYQQSFGDSNLGIFFVGGFDLTSTVLTNNFYIFYTDTFSYRSAAPINITPGCAVQNNEKGYLISGIGGELLTANQWTNIIQGYTYATDSWSILKSTILMDRIGDATSV